MNNKEKKASTIEQRNYWIKKLAKGFEPTSIKYYDNVTSQLSEKKGKHEFLLSTETVQKLNKLTNNMDFLLYVVLLTGLNICIKKHTSKSAITVGSPTIIKDDIEAKELNVIPIINQVKSQDTFRTLLGKVRTTLISDIEMQDYHYTQLINELGLVAEGQFPLFDIVLSFTNIHNELPEINCGMVIKLTKNNGISGVIEYDTQKYSSHNIEVFLSQYTNIIDSMLDNTDIEIKQLDMISENEKHNILVKWNETEIEYRRNKCIHELFMEQASATPDKVAVVYENQTLTYRELDEKSNQFANYLRKQGVGSNDRIAICIEPSLEMIICLYGTLKSGAGYIPVDYKYPVDRIKFMIEDSNPSLLITKSSLSKLFDNTEAKLVYVDEAWSEIEKESSINPIIEDITTSNLAYIIYTSGSTGEPKGSAVHQKGWTNLLNWFTRQFEITDRDKTLLISSFSFDLTQKNLFATLLVGGQLHIRKAEYYDPTAITNYINDKEITLLNCTPSAFYPLIDENIEGMKEKLVSLRCLFLGGEPISMLRLKKWIQSSSCKAEIFNTYGPTECTDISNFYKIDKKLDIDKSTVPIGKPIYNTQIYLLNEDNEIVPVGVAGELCISGDGVGMGYINDKEMTTKKFIKHPYLERENNLLYKTGDMAYYLPDGNISYIGRVDNQVKIRGFRIELGEIEKVIKQHEGVQEVAVVVNENSNGEKRLVAYIEPHKKASGVVRNILEHKNDETESSQSLYEASNGMTVFHLNKTETEFIYREIFEEFIYLRNGITLTDGCTILDVGANIGMFSLFASKICKNPKIHAFEPIKPIYNVLKQNISLYDLNNVKTHEMGLSDNKRIEDITFYPNVSIMSGRYADDEEDHDSIKTAILREQKMDGSKLQLTEKEIDELVKERLKKEVYSCDFDTISNIISKNNIQNIDLLKVDVEKSELDILQGINDRDWQTIKQVVLEVHDHEGRLDEICNVLEAKGYEVIAEKDSKLEDNDIYNVYAIHSTQKVLQEAAIARDYSRQEKEYNSIRFLMESVKQWIKDRLPEYMIPNKFLLLNDLPLSPNEKVDRQALSKLSINLADEYERYIEPANKIEAVVEKIWAGVLDMNKVSVEDDFIELGGYSLLATAIISKVRKQYNVDIPIYLFFENPTIRKFSQLIEKLIEDKTL